MKLSFALTIEDYTAFNYFFYAARYKKRYRLIGSILLLLIVINLLSLLTKGTFTINNLFSAPILVCCLYFVVVLVFQSKWFLTYKCRQLVNSGKNAGLLGDRTLVFDEMELNVVTEFYDCKYKWKGFENLKKSPKHLFLFTGVNQAIIIPKRIFLLAQEEHDIKSFIERKLAEQKVQDHE